MIRALQKTDATHKSIIQNIILEFGQLFGCSGKKTGGDISFPFLKELSEKECKSDIKRGRPVLR